MAPVKWTDEALLKELKKFYQEHGRPPKQSEFQVHGYPPPITYRRHFGNWNKALIAAGLPTNLKTSSKDWKKWSIDKLLYEFKNEYEQINPKTSIEFEKNRSSKFPSLVSIQKHTSLTWEDLKEKIGLDRTYHSDEWWIEKIREINIGRKTPYSLTEATNILGYGMRSFLYRYGNSYNELLKVLGMEPAFKTPKDVKESNEELIELYKSYSKRLGRPATSLDIDSDPDMYSTSVFTIRFGGINKLRKAARMPITPRKDYKFSKQFFINIFNQLIDTYGYVKDEDLKEIMREYGTSISTALKYFRKTSTKEIWEEVWNLK